MSNQRREKGMVSLPSVALKALNEPSEKGYWLIAEPYDVRLSKPCCRIQAPNEEAGGWFGRNRALDQAGATMGLLVVTLVFDISEYLLDYRFLDRVQAKVVHMRREHGMKHSWEIEEFIEHVRQPLC